MFDDEILERIFAHPDTKKISITDVTTMIRVIEEVLYKVGVEKNAISKS